MDVNKAYFLGLHCGDGCIGVNRTYRHTKTHGTREYQQWYFHYGSTDRELCSFIRDLFKIKNYLIPVEDSRSSKVYFRLNTHNKDLTKFLLSCGFSERKSIDLPTLTSSVKGFEIQFLLGYLDSDGCVTNDYFEWIGTNLELLQWLGSWLESFSVKHNIYGPYNNLYSLRVRSKDGVELIKKWCYTAPLFSRKLERLRHQIRLL